MFPERVGARPMRKSPGWRSVSSNAPIGPGRLGWTDEEFAPARPPGFRKPLWGNLILRTETAGDSGSRWIELCDWLD